MATLLIHNARLAGESRSDAWVLIDDDRIAAMGYGLPKPEAYTRIDADGALMMPGVIDCHVHFREPGLTDKADILSESRAALAGGVTSYIDMPNTKPPTTTIEAWEQKCTLAAEKSWGNYAFFIGATNDNIDTLKDADYSRIPGVKLFMGSSTGNMLVDDEAAIARIFREVDAIVAVHTEDQSIIGQNIARAREQYGDDVPVELHSTIRSEEACYQCTRRAVEVARKSDHRLHVCHLTTKREMDMIASLQQGQGIEEKLITTEVSPHHLLWCDQDYAAKGTRIKMNPAVKTDSDRMALREGLIDGKIDMVATDHAPHQLCDKQGGALHAASGAPLAQFSLPVMLSIFDETLVQQVMCENPATIYGIEGRGHLRQGAFADIILVREDNPYAITDDDVLSKCGWTPVDGVVVRHRIDTAIVNGVVSYRNGKFVERSARALNFRNN